MASTSELIRRLKRTGFSLMRHGKKHDIYANPAGKKLIISGMPVKSPTGSATPSSGMQASGNFATMKVRTDFLAWLRRESARRGTFLYETIEEIMARSYGGMKPWRKDGR